MTLNNLVKPNEINIKVKKRKNEETKDVSISRKKICMTKIECPICTENIPETELMACYYCNYKWCKKCIIKSDDILYNKTKKLVQEQSNIEYDLIKKLINLQSCPICRSFKCFKEEKNDSNFNSFKNEFKDNIKYLSEDLYNNTEKQFKCNNCGINKKSSKLIPQCNECGLFNMMEL
jgi:hypothetical protein